MSPALAGRFFTTWEAHFFFKNKSIILRDLGRLQSMGLQRVEQN